MRRVVLLGGSSPFTAAFVDALIGAAEPIPGQLLVLHGRHANHLGLVARHAARRLTASGWRVEQTTSLDEALAGADIVLNQIRFGGLEGRAEDESLAREFGVRADETLGASALNSILRITPELRRLGDRLVARCPDAWVLNLTNPLSIATSVLLDSGVGRCVGLCELPRFTAGLAADLLKLPLSSIRWSYVGLNHRGFITRFETEGRDLIGEVAAALGETSLGGVSAAEIAALHALPSKYYSWLVEPPRTTPSRAEFLSRLRESILDELRADPAASPSSLEQRYTEWYPCIVVPMIAALVSEAPSSLVVNSRDQDDIVRELHAEVSSAGVRTSPPEIPPPAAARWVRRFEDHERAQLELVRSPCRSTLRRVVERDPLAPGDVEGLVKRLCRRHGIG